MILHRFVHSSCSKDKQFSGRTPEEGLSILVQVKFITPFVVSGVEFFTVM